MKTTARALLDRAPTLSVGMLTADLLHLGDELAALEDTGVEIVHVDVMDGVFCPQLTVGPAVVEAIPDRFVKDCHLMIDQPLDKLAAFVDAGAGIITFHLEASLTHAHRALSSLAGSGVVRGLAVNPGTPVAAVEPLLDDLELLLILAIDPGWRGQSFIPQTEARIHEARRLIGGREIVLGLDGGITSANLGYVGTIGADLVVSGSAIFDGIAPHDNARRMIQELRRTASTR